jgi:hypothetical protein
MRLGGLQKEFLRTLVDTQLASAAESIIWDIEREEREWLDRRFPDPVKTMT